MLSQSPTQHVQTEPLVWCTALGTERHTSNGDINFDIHYTIMCMVCTLHMYVISVMVTCTASSPNACPTKGDEFGHTL